MTLTLAERFASSSDLAIDLLLAQAEGPYLTNVSSSQGGRATPLAGGGRGRLPEAREGRPPQSVGRARA